MNNNKNEYVLVLSKIQRTKEENMELISKVNNLLSDLKDTDTTISIYTYNSGVSVEKKRVSINEIETLTTGLISSRAKKSVYFEAMVTAINETGEALYETAEEDRPCKVIVISEETATDNASTEETENKLFEMIKLQKNVYSWEFRKI